MLEEAEPLGFLSSVWSLGRQELVIKVTLVTQEAEVTFFLWHYVSRSVLASVTDTFVFSLHTLWSLYKPSLRGEDPSGSSGCSGPETCNFGSL